jgi:hypothetical protein
MVEIEASEIVHRIRLPGLGTLGAAAQVAFESRS